MAAAKPGDKVKVHYTGSLGNGQVFDSSAESEPIEFTIGSGEVIPGFEEAIVGMAPGERKTHQVPVEQAYGPYRDDLKVDISRTELPPGVDFRVGQHLRLEAPDGSFSHVQISEVSDQAVTFDGNHPLAGQDLTFDIELVEILAA